MWFNPQAALSGAQRTLLARSAKKNAHEPPPPPGKAHAKPPPPGPSHRVCDAKCQTQVKQLEAGASVVHNC